MNWKRRNDHFLISKSIFQNSVITVSPTMNILFNFVTIYAPTFYIYHLFSLFSMEPMSFLITNCIT